MYTFLCGQNATTHQKEAPYDEIERHIDSALDSFDKNKDGQISYREFTDGFPKNI